MKFSPMKGNLICEVVHEYDTRKTESGILLPDQTAERMRFIVGKVIAAAKTKYSGGTDEHPLCEVPMELKKGDIIIFDEYTTKEFTLEGKQYYCLPEGKAYAKIDK